MVEVSVFRDDYTGLESGEISASRRSLRDWTIGKG